MTAITIIERAACPICGHEVEFIGTAKIAGSTKVGRCINCGSVNLFADLIQEEANEKVLDQRAEQCAQNHCTNR